MPQSGLDPMIDQEKFPDLARLYRLFSMVDTGLSTLKRALKESISRRGKIINEVTVTVEAEDGNKPEGDEEMDVKNKGKGKAKAIGGGPVTAALQWVEDILSLKDIFDNVLRHSFNNDSSVQVALNEVSMLDPVGILLFTIVLGV